MTLEEYYEKRKKAQIREACELVREYSTVYGKDPDDDAMSEFFWLFSNDVDPNHMPASWKSQMSQAGNIDYSFEKLSLNEKKWSDMQSFLILYITRRNKGVKRK